MNVWRSLNGTVRLRLISADPAGALTAINNAGITVYDTGICDDEITAEFTLQRQDVKKVREIASTKGYGLKLHKVNGLYWFLIKAVNRPVLTFGLALLLGLSLFLPTRVLFIRVEGNETVPTRLILEKCADCGISFGASRRAVRSERVKNALLESVPALQWAGINTSGCVATVTVRERAVSQYQDTAVGVSSIVAARDGVVLSCTATSGTLCCRVGQVVREGQVLISGYTDCGITIRADLAEGEIFAQTRRELAAITPTEWAVDGEIGATEKKYAIIIGKKRINFYKGSGISGTTCDKIYEENYMTLPGGFVLPIAIVTETWILAEQTAGIRSAEEAEAVLTAFSQWYLPSRMTAGSVLTAWETVTEDDGIAILQGSYACTEMIGRERDEEIITPYGNDN